MVEGWAARKPGKGGHTGSESGSSRGLRLKLTEELSEGLTWAVTRSGLQL